MVDVEAKNPPRCLTSREVPGLDEVIDLITIFILCDGIPSTVRSLNPLSAIGVFIRLTITSAYRDRRIYTPNDTAYANSGGPDLCT